jgi:hypothetical protein
LSYYVESHLREETHHFWSEAQAVDMQKKKLRATISLFVICALFLAPVSVRPCETTEALDHACCSCPCCQHAGSCPSEGDAQEDECSCRIAEKHDEENSPAVVVSINHNKLQTPLLTSSIEGSFEHDQGESADSDSGDPIFPSRDQPLYILHSSFLI